MSVSGWGWFYFCREGFSNFWEKIVQILTLFLAFRVFKKPIFCWDLFFIAIISLKSFHVFLYHDGSIISGACLSDGPSLSFAYCSRFVNSPFSRAFGTYSSVSSAFTLKVNHFRINFIYGGYYFGSYFHLNVRPQCCKRFPCTYLFL